MLITTFESAQQHQLSQEQHYSGYLATAWTVEKDGPWSGTQPHLQLYPSVISDLPRVDDLLSYFTKRRRRNLEMGKGGEGEVY